MNKAPYTNELHLKSFRNEKDRHTAIMNRRKFLQGLSAIAPAYLVASTLSTPTAVPEIVTTVEDFVYPINDVLILGE